MKKRLFATAIVALAFVGTATGTASAESQSEAVLVNEVMNSGNPQETYNALSKKDKAVFLRAMSPSSVEQSVSAPTVTATRSSGTCRTANHHQDWKSNYGFVVATSWLSMEWCSSGNKVTSVRITNQGGETSTPAYYDLIWTFFPIIYIGLLGIVILFEVRRKSGANRIIAWSLVQLLFPIIGFIVWGIFFFSEKRFGDKGWRAKELDRHES